MPARATGRLKKTRASAVAKPGAPAPDGVRGADPIEVADGVLQAVAFAASYQMSTEEMARRIMDDDEYIKQKKKEGDDLEALLQKEIKEVEQAEAEAAEEERKTKAIGNQIDDYLVLRAAFVKSGDKENGKTVIKLLENYLIQNGI